MAAKRTWLQRMLDRWTPPIAVGTSVTVGGDAGWTVKGADYGNRKLLVAKAGVFKTADPSTVVVS